MPNGDKKTVKEHYVPKCYLKNFAAKMTSEKDYLFCYDTQTGKWLNNGDVICTDDFCQEKYLYELVNRETKKVDNTNITENALGRIESNILSPLFKRLIDIVNCNPNYSGKSLLNIKDKNEILIAIALQMIRTPEALSSVSDFLCKYLETDKISCDNLAKIISFPCYSFPVEGYSILHSLIKNMCSLKFTLCCSVTLPFITSQDPVVPFHANSMIYPISPFVAVLAREECSRNEGNILLTFNDKTIREVNSLQKDRSRYLFSYNKQLCFRK